jgi:hypothetical protein
LKEHLNRENFFIENFDAATPQHIIDQVKRPSPIEDESKDAAPMPLSSAESPFENFGS